jgi:NGP1NT (NUC091) domain
MAPLKKSSSPSKTRSSSSNVSLAKVKGENFYRNAKQVARLKMLSGGKPIRDKDGKIVQAAAFQKGEDETKPGRVQPDRRWFGANPTFGWFYVCRCSLLELISREYESHLSDGSGPLPNKSC